MAGTSGSDGDRDLRPAPKRRRLLRALPLSTAAIGADGPGRADRDRGIKWGYERHVKALQVACIISSENDERGEWRALCGRSPTSRYAWTGYTPVVGMGSVSSALGPVGWFTGNVHVEPAVGVVRQLAERHRVVPERRPDTSPPRAAWNCERAVSLP